MKWRCTWCGKPHENNDPPCDECGHHKFEKAIEQINPGTGEPTDPVWVCTECGRSHQKHSPPCSRCGNVDLEKRQPDYSDLDDLGGTSYLDVLEPKYAVGYVLVAILLGVLALGMVGVIDLPTLGEASPPEAPGHADSYENLSLAGVEAAYIERLNDERERAGVEHLATDDGLATMATAYNRQRVQADHANGTEPSVRDVVDRYDTNCGRTIAPLRDTVPAAAAWGNEDGEADAASVGRNLYQAYVDIGDHTLDAEYTAAGIDVHVAPDDTVYVALFLCG